MTRRLVLSYLLITVIVLAVLGVPLAIFYGQLERERFLARAERDAVALGAYYEGALAGDAELDPVIAERYSQRVGARSVIVDANGISLIDTSEQPAGRDFSNRPEIAEALSGLRSTGYRNSETLNRDFLYVALPISSGNEIRGAVRIAVDADVVTGRIRRFRYGLLAVAALVLLLLALVGWTIARSVTEPLRTLQTSALRLGRGEFDAIDPPDPEAPQEVQDLTETMNAMADQLALLVDRHRSFVGDTSHQLRTPLTALRLRLENLEADDRLDVEHRIELEAAIDETVRMGKLVNDLLRLARTNQHPQLSSANLIGLVADRVDTWKAVADQASVTLLFDVPRVPVRALSVTGAVEQILDNLLDNALHVSPPDSSIRIELIPGSRWHRLMVADHGPGLNDAEKVKATERFWSGDGKPAGSGLGLTIVTSLLQASGGSLSLEDNRPRGLRVVCWFQAAPMKPSPANTNGQAVGGRTGGWLNRSDLAGERGLGL